MYSEFAALIDALLALDGYNDLLFFIAVGNVTDKENIPNDLQKSVLERAFNQNHVFHWGTNLMCPADGLNAFSIGSVNQIGIVSAFSRKHCLDYATVLSDQRNLPTYWISWCARVRKPDMLLNGEELKVLSSDIDQDRIANGTSFSTPLATNMAARIWNLYPTIRANTVKALLINSCGLENTLLSYDIDNRTTLPDPIASRLASFNCDAQTREERKSIEQRYLGYGRPDPDRAMYSNENRVTLILEDEIELNSQKSYELSLPPGKNIFEGKGYFQISAALVFNTVPVVTDHLDYNPILISFRIISCAPDLYRSLIDERKAVNRDYLQLADQFETSQDSSLRPEIERLEKKLKEIEDKIKSHVIHKWSQDNYYHYQYSNTQKVNDRFLKKTLRDKTSNGTLPLFLEVRCNIKSRDKKSHIFKAMQDFIEQNKNVVITEFSELQTLFQPKFSFAFTLEDSNQDLYVDLLEANASRVEVLATAEAEAVAEVDNSV